MDCNMNILFSIHLYPPRHLAGAETMAHSIAKHLQSKGHTVKVLIWEASHYGIESHYVYDNVDVFPNDDNIVLNLFQWADVVFTHLGFAKKTIHLAAMHKMPCFTMIHNTQPYQYIIDAEKPQYIIYNSEASRDILQYKHESIVVRPPMDYRLYEGKKGDAITLINLNENKGADIFYRLAEIMPERRFIGVKGSYDDQLTGKILEHKDYVIKNAEGIFKKVLRMDKTPNNVEIWEKQTDIRKVYEQTGILIMPSRYESYGRTGPEAMSSGIPVICTSTFGLLESCGSAGIYVQNRDDINEWVKAIKMLDKKKAYEDASRKAKERAMELDPRKELDELELWVRESKRNYK